MSTNETRKSLNMSPLSIGQRVRVGDSAAKLRGLFGVVEALDVDGALVVLDMGGSFRATFHPTEVHPA